MASITKGVRVSLEVTGADNVKRVLGSVSKTADELNNKNVKPTLGLSKEDFDASKTAALADLKKLGDTVASAKVKLGTSEFDAQYLGVLAKLDALNKRASSIGDFDSAGSSSKLLRLQAAIAGLGGNVEKLGQDAEKSTGKLSKLTSVLDAGYSKMRAFNSEHSALLWGAALAPGAASLGMSLAPVAAVAGAGGLAGGLAAGAFGGLAKADLTQITTAQQTPGALAALVKAEPGIKGLATALQGLQTAFHKFQSETAGAVSTGLVPFFDGLEKVLASPATATMIGQIGKAVGGLGGQFTKLVTSSEFTKFEGFIGGTGSKVLSAGGSVVMNAIKGIMNLLPDFAPLIGKAATGVENLGTDFAAWSGSKSARDDVQKFIGFFTSNKGTLETLFKNVATDLGKLGGALGSNGVTELKAATTLLGLLAKLPQGAFNGIVTAASALALIAKVSPILKGGVKITASLVGGGWKFVQQLLQGNGLKAAIKSAFGGQATDVMNVKAGEVNVTGAVEPGEGGVVPGGAAGKGEEEGEEGVEAGEAESGGMLAGLSGGGMLTTGIGVAGLGASIYQADQGTAAKTTGGKWGNVGMSAASGAMSGAMAGMAFGPEGALVGAGVGALAAGLTSAIHQFPAVKRFFTSDMGNWAKTGWDAVERDFFKPITSFFTGNTGWEKAIGRFFTSTIPDAAESAYHGVTGWIGRMGSDIATWFTQTVPSELKSAATRIWGDIESPFKTAFDWVTAKSKEAWTWFTSTLPSELKSGISRIWGDVESPFVTAFNWVTAKSKEAWTWFTSTLPSELKSGASRIWSDLESPFSTALNWVTSHAKEAWTWFTSTLPADLRSAAGRILGDLESPFEDAFSWVRNNVGLTLHIPSITLFGHHFGGGSVRLGFASGGVVPGSGLGDSVPAMLTPGERVLSRSQVAMLGGHRAIDRVIGRSTGWNSGLGYAAGGVIDGMVPAGVPPYPGGGGGQVVIQFNGLVTDPDSTARKVQQLLLDYRRHNGNRALGFA